MSQENVNIERVGGVAVTTTLPVSGAVTVSGVATAGNQATEIASLANLDVALSTRLKPADTLAAVTSITNPVAVTLAVAPTTAVTVADGSSVVEGLTTDVAVQGDTLGTISAKLRGINLSLQQLQQADARNVNALMAQFSANQQPGAGFVVTPEVPAFLGGF